MNHLAAGLITPTRLGPADAIVVLGADSYPDGTLGASSLRRTVVGILLARKEVAPLLLLLGSGGRPGRSETEVRATLARDLGLPGERILVESRAVTTREEAQRAAARLHPLGVRRILLVTDGQHLGRAGALFERVGFEVLPVAASEMPPGEAQTPEERLHLLRGVVQEIVARAYYRLAGYL